MSNEAAKRAEMPSGTAILLEERSVENSNHNLLAVLRPGQTVLDVGGGSGAITQGITRYVGNSGKVYGIDSSEELIGIARNKYGHIPNLEFIHGDIMRYETSLRFDIITVARTLQWLTNPVDVIAKLKQLLKPGGILCILDYNHTKATWDPQPPQSMVHFYDKFLQWRQDVGMDNEIADHLSALLSEQGFSDITITDESERGTLSDPGFHAHANIWAVVAKLRGKQLVTDNYITEDERLLAIEEYETWVASAARSHTMYLRGVHGTLK
ncbi:methyltransferase domain-containing protein [Chitinophaga sp. Cy-1792]|uniref:methyltransferase domain-containing protein n=1 Tax=Chitinophaga sp. Cy-1792 TaxID=2608339 RepID=UPI001423653B|nr:methyltransferase domain-containing protein [Chitinophaga sp. Cy-1792]NIG56453.1 methyltransferase domain-containing protein [Chitinophaga sp. Cy-1792]